MSRIEGTSSVGRTQSHDELGSGPSVGSSALPDPVNGMNLGNSLAVLQSVLRKMSENGISVSKSKIERNEQAISKAIEDAFQARKREAEARSKDGGFFGGLATAFEALTVDLVKLKNITDPFKAVENSLEKAGDATINNRQFWADLEKGALEVAKWGAVAGSTAVAIGSFGAAAPVAALAIAGAVMSMAAAADSSFDILEKCGVDAKTAKWIDVGLCIGGALCSGGAGIVGGAGKGGSSLMTAVRIGGTVADATAGTAAVAGGTAKIQVAAFERTAMHAEADAVSAENTQRSLERRIQTTLDAVRETIESCERGATRISEAVNKHTATTVALVRA